MRKITFILSIFIGFSALATERPLSPAKKLVTIEKLQVVHKENLAKLPRLKSTGELSSRLVNR